MNIIPIEISARHIHISQKDLEILFGEGYELKKLKDLSQQGEFATEKTIDIQNGSKMISEVRILGPVREQTQVEISKTDCYSLKLDAPLRLSGDLKDSAGITLIGSEGNLDLKEGVIVAKRHLHCSPENADKLNIKDKDVISVKVEGMRSLIFNNVVVRVGENDGLAMQVDTDEGNAAGIIAKGEGRIV